MSNIINNSLLKGRLKIFNKLDGNIIVRSQDSILLNSEIETPYNNRMLLKYDLAPSTSHIENIYPVFDSHI